MTKLEEGDIILCTVTEIVGTVVHVKIENSDTEGSIVTSEIAPGRIRNIRDYVVPHKKIVCKILRVSQSGSLDLSLRRVTMKERKEVLDEYKKEQTGRSVIRSVAKDKVDKIIKELEEKREKVQSFLQKIKEDPKIGEKYFTKAELDKLILILNKQKIKKIEIKKEITFTTDQSNGLVVIKKILAVKKANMKYVAAGRYLLSVETENVKEAQHIIQEALDEIEKRAKQEKIHLEIKDKK